MTLPEDFNWVKAYADCSVAQVFESLRSQVKRDVATREEIRDRRDSHYSFRFASEPWSFTALVEGNQVHRTVTFTLKDKKILIQNNDEKNPLSLEISVGLNNDGLCVARINDQEYEFWQIRKKALEKLFFVV